MTSHNNTGLKIALVSLFVLYAVFTAMDATSFSQGPNNRNVSVDTRVNVTQAFPEILSVIVAGGADNVTLSAGSVTYIECNATVRDYNGGATITSANATFFDNTTSFSGDTDDNNTHYTNGSCATTATDGYFRNFTCTFPVQYYANVGYWTCEVNVTDDYSFTDAASNYTHLDAVLALNVTTLIDYGDLAVGDISSPQQANVTNIGNVDINVSVRGYGETLDDGLSFVCDVGNISVEYEMFNLQGLTSNPADYVNLSASYQDVINLTIPQQTNDSQQEINATYWLLEVPPNPFGLCNGTVVFQAEES